MNDNSLEQPSRSPIGGEETKESIQALVTSFFQKRLDELADIQSNPDAHGVDFGVARWSAYLQAIQAEKYFDPVDIKGTYDGNPAEKTEESPYDFFRGILTAVDNLKTYFPDDLALINRAETEAHVVKPIIEKMAPLKPPSSAPPSV